MKDIGATSSFFSFPKRSHNWGERMNDNIVKTAVALHASCIDFVDALPGSGMQEGDTYVLNTDSKIYVWVDSVVQDTTGPIIQPAQWYVMSPSPGYMILNRANMCQYVYANGQWIFVWEIGAQHRVVERELTFYIPYLVRPKSILFHYVAGTELTIQAGAPGSGATAEIAPSGGVVIAIRHNGLQVGTITFGAGSTEGVVSFPARIVVHPSIDESEYVQAHSLSLHSPDDTFGMQGLSVSLKGEIRSIDQ